MKKGKEDTHWCHTLTQCHIPHSLAPREDRLRGDCWAAGTTVMQRWKRTNAVNSSVNRDALIHLPRWSQTVRPCCKLEYTTLGHNCCYVFIFTVHTTVFQPHNHRSDDVNPQGFSLIRSYRPGPPVVKATWIMNYKYNWPCCLCSLLLFGSMDSNTTAYQCYCLTLVNPCVLPLTSLTKWFAHTGTNSCIAEAAWCKVQHWQAVK